MGKKVARFVFLVISIGVIFFITSIITGCNDTNSSVIIEGPTDLLSDPDWKDAPGNKVISILQKGEQGKVIHVRYSKDFMFYKIALDDGRTGYVKFGDNFKVIEDQKK